MSVMSTVKSPEDSWAEANLAFLNRHLDRLRLRLHRRVLWLRGRWKGDSLAGYRSMVISDAEADMLLTSTDRSEELKFYREDPDALEISRDLAATERELAESSGRLVEDAFIPALEALVRMFALSPFERDVLLLCLAPGLDPAFARLFAYIHDNVHARHATPYLALTTLTTPALCEGDEDWQDAWLAARSCLTFTSAVRRYRLIQFEHDPSDPSPPHCSPIKLDERISNYLLGINVTDPDLARRLAVIPPMPLPPAHGQLVERLAKLLSHRPQTVVNLIGSRRAGKDGIALAVSTLLGGNAYRLEADELPTASDELQQFMHLLERETALLSIMIYVHVENAHLVQGDGRSPVASLVKRIHMGLFVGSESRLQVDRMVCGCPVPEPDSTEQLSMWREVLGETAPHLTREAGRIVQQFDFDPGSIANAAAAAHQRAGMRDPEDGEQVTAEDLWQACRDQIGWALSDLAQRISPCFDWDDIVLPPDAEAQLHEITAQVANRSIVYGDWSFGEKLSRGRGITALFSGPSGTGKTMAAEVLANHLKLDLYRIDLAGVVNKYIGETEKRLRQVFDAAESSGAILFFDECDSLFGKRTDVRDSHDRYANIEVNYLLQRMEDYTGLAILATNRKSALDQAFLRRLRFILAFELPDAEDRNRIWRRIFPAKARLDSIDFQALSRLKLTGANIKNIALNAAFVAADQSSPITMTHLMRAARREYAKIERLVTESDFGRFYRIEQP